MATIQEAKQRLIDAIYTCPADCAKPLAEAYAVLVGVEIQEAELAELKRQTDTA